MGNPSNIKARNRKYIGPLISLGLLFIFILLLVLHYCISISVQYFFYLIITFWITDYFSYSKNSVKTKFISGGVTILGSFGIYYLILKTTPDIFKTSINCKENISFTIKIKSKEDLRTQLRKNKSYISIDENGFSKMPIDENGEAVFTFINGNIELKNVPINIISNVIETKFKDSLYSIENNSRITIEVKRIGLGYINGRILSDKTGEPLENVKITLLNITPVFTNQEGYFKINIPESMWNETQEIVVKKDKYKVLIENITVDTSTIIGLTLKEE